MNQSLQKAFNFTPDDLMANRSGFVGEHQRQRESQKLRILLLSIALMLVIDVIIIIALYLFLPDKIKYVVIAFLAVADVVMAFVLGRVMLPSFRQRLQAMETSSVYTLENVGREHLRPAAATYTNLEKDGVHLQLNSLQANALRHDQRYRVYYVQGDKSQILSVEAEAD